MIKKNCNDEDRNKMEVYFDVDVKKFSVVIGFLLFRYIRIILSMIRFIIGKFFVWW